MPAMHPPQYLNSRLRYDPETGKLFWKIKENASLGWNTRWAGKEAFTAKSHGHHVGRLDGENYYAHRVIWAMQTGEWPEDQVDHINGDRTDNRWVNLRAATVLQNSFNRGPQSNGSSGFKGVTWHSQQGRWAARIQAGGVNKSLGLHDTAEQAAAAYDAAARKMHMAFSRANFGEKYAS